MERCQILRLAAGACSSMRVFSKDMRKSGTARIAKSSLSETMAFAPLRLNDAKGWTNGTEHNNNNPDGYGLFCSVHDCLHLEDEMTHILTFIIGGVFGVFLMCIVVSGSE